MTFRLGLMVDAGAPAPAWFQDAIERAVSVSDVDVVGLIEVEHPTPAGAILPWPDGVPVQRWFHRVAQRTPSASPGDREALRALERIGVRPAASGSATIEFSSTDVSRVREWRLDAILRLGRGRLRGEILGAASDGVWAFDHHEHDESWGRIVGLAEVAAGEVTVTTRLVRIGETPASTVTLASGTVHVDRHSYAATLDRALQASARWPAERCQQLLTGVAASTAPASATVDQPVPAQPERPSRSLVLRAAAREQLSGVRRRVRRLLYEEQWNVGVSIASVESWLDPATRMRGVRWLPEPTPEVFLADPFPLSDGDDLAILVEEFQRPLGRGVIRRIDFEARSGFTVQDVVLTEPHHLSYPFILKEGGQRYCIPETGDAREVGLYQLDDQGQWRKAAVLIPDRDLVDATVVWQGDRWWMWAADRDIDQWAALTVWHAPALTGPWVEHARSPVKLDVGSSRPGGTPFVHNGELYRPAQDCARTYGSRLVINRVVELTPTTYREEVARIVEPEAPYGHGTHHLAAAGRYSLVDGKRWMRRSLLDVAGSVRTRLTGRG